MTAKVIIENEQPLTKKQRNCYEFYFRHFSLRLSERYGLFITFDEYVEFCRLPYIRGSKYIKNRDGQMIKDGIVVIQDIKVRVLRSTSKYTPLLTALI
jgi:hypothetical protein